MKPGSTPAAGIAFVMLVLASASGCREGVPERVRALHALGRKPTEAHKVRIRQALDDPDRDVRAAALVVMGEADRDLARAMAARAIDDADGWVRTAAVRVLGAGADAETVARLARLGPGDPMPQVRTAVLEAVAPFDGEEVRAAWAAGLDDPIRQVRAAALRAGLLHPGALPADRLARILAEDTEWENRVLAAQALGASNDPAAYPPLEAAAGDPNEFVRAAAAREVAALTRAGTPRPGV